MWNNELISSITLGAAATVPIIVAITQLFKFWVPDKFIPFVSLGVGVVISFLMANDQRDFSAVVLAGILFGLAASGLYSGVKTSAHAIKADKHKNAENQKKNKY